MSIEGSIAEIGKIISVIPAWAGGISVAAVTMSAAISIPFALSNTSIISWLRWKILKEVMPSKHMACTRVGEARLESELRAVWVNTRDTWRGIYLRECMDTGTRTLELISVSLRDIYRKELDELTGINEIAKAADYDTFCLMLKRFMEEMKDRFRAYARENGYYAMSYEEFQEYMTVKPAAMISNASEIFDLYHHSCYVSRSKFKEITKGLMKDIMSRTEMCFEYARTRSVYWCEIRKSKYNQWIEAHKIVYGSYPIEKCD